VFVGFVPDGGVGVGLVGLGDGAEAGTLADEFGFDVAGLLEFVLPVEFVVELP